ncbi:MAG: hypothetical protein NT027_16285 [Proteobacteria bacterium]|nr:hypothetical protein [Pseudomonadota bacterium]
MRFTSKFFAFVAYSLAASFSASAAFAQELDWKIVKTRSVGKGVSCDPNSMQIIQAGGDMTLIFNEMRVDLPAGVSPKQKSEWGSCNVGLNLTIPKNYYITSASSSVVGGVEKDKGTHGYIDARTYLVRRLPTILDPVNGGGPFGKILHAQRIFRHNEIINEPLLVISDNKDFKAKHVKQMCDWTKNNDASIGMLVNLSVAGQRMNSSKTIIVSADNIDSHFDLGLKLDKCH